MRWCRPLPFAVIAALTLVGCGRGNGERSASTPPEPSIVAASGSPVEVSIEAFAYVPPQIEVAAGTAVRWTNEDAFAHTVTSGTPDHVADRFDGVMGDLGEMTAAGETFSFTFTDAGTYTYFCRFHPLQMRATVVVTR